MKSSSKLLLAVLVSLVVTNAHGMRWYSPNTGRWFSRDPIGEQGGVNLYAFLSGDGINTIDMIGLSPLRFKSAGRFYFDGNWVRASHSGGESGERATTDAWYWLTASEVYACPGGICNSGGSRIEASSFVTAEVRNITKCKVAVSCHCYIFFHVSNWSPDRNKGVLVKGHVLGKKFSHEYVHQLNPAPRTFWEKYMAEGYGKEEHWLSFFLAPRQSRELYHGYDQNSSAAGVSGAGFSEYMSGACTCEAK